MKSPLALYLSAALFAAPPALAQHDHGGERGSHARPVPSRGPAPGRPGNGPASPCSWPVRSLVGGPPPSLPCAAWKPLP